MTSLYASFMAGIILFCALLLLCVLFPGLAKTAPRRRRYGIGDPNQIRILMDYQDFDDGSKYDIIRIEEAIAQADREHPPTPGSIAHMRGDR